MDGYAFWIEECTTCLLRIVDQAMSGLVRTGAFVDDKARGSCDQAGIPDDIRCILERIRAAKLKLKPCKCTIGYLSVQFVGHTLSSKGIEMQMEMAQWVLDMAAPNDTHGVRSFLGLASYYRRFIKRFAKMAKPLTAMLTAKSIFKWGPGGQSSFVKFKASSGKRTCFDAA